MDEPVEKTLINDVSRDEIIDALNSLVKDPAYQTRTPFHVHSNITFIEHHLTYLKGHPSLNPYHYMANLKLMLKKRT
jgi:hypothetical protein